MRYLVTGGAGFIGSALYRKLAADPDNHVVALDKLTYAGSFGGLKSLQAKSNFKFVRGDICDRILVGDTLQNDIGDYLQGDSPESVFPNNAIDGLSTSYQDKVGNWIDYVENFEAGR